MKRDLQFGLVVTLMLGMVLSPRFLPKLEKPVAETSGSQALANSTEPPAIVPAVVRTTEANDKAALTTVFPEGYPANLQAPKSDSSKAALKSETGKPAESATKTETPSPFPMIRLPLTSPPKSEPSKPVESRSDPRKTDPAPPETSKQVDSKSPANQETPKADQKPEPAVKPTVKTESIEVVETAVPPDDSAPILVSHTKSKGTTDEDSGTPSRKPPPISRNVSLPHAKDSPLVKEYDAAPSVKTKAEGGAQARRAGGPIHPFFQRYLERREYFVREGDTLKNIAYRLYRDEEKAYDLLATNPKLLRKPEDLKPGMLLKLP